MRVWVSVWTGSTIICRAVAVWIAGGAVARLLVLVLAAGFIKGLPHSWDMALVLAWAWLVTAVVLGLREPWPPASPKSEEPAPAEGEPEAPSVSRDDLVIALHTVADPHAHTAVVAAHLGASPEAVREALAAADIPTKAVRMKGRRTSTGVDRSAFPPLPPSADRSLEDVVCAGQPSNNNKPAFETVPDQKRPQRTLVRWLKAK
ncbi:hypothetical protein [Streptomyces sp. NPDC050264]|uniref:hypothetical protein n=1 Tax=Streptomyces sp. NPDC050264 TaxID=3155038 RepID=UPI003427240F